MVRILIQGETLGNCSCLFCVTSLRTAGNFFYPKGSFFLSQSF